MFYPGLRSKGVKNEVHLESIPENRLQLAEAKGKNVYRIHNVASNG